MPPGVTEPATLRLRDEERVLASLGGDVEQAYRGIVLPFKLRASIEYLERRTLWSDLGVIASTALAIVRPGSPPSADELRAAARGDDGTAA